jgi:hypothetical protein
MSEPGTSKVVNDEMRTCVRCQREYENPGYFDLWGKDLTSLCVSCRHDEWIIVVQRFIAIDILLFIFGSLALFMGFFMGDIYHILMVLTGSAALYAFGFIFIGLTKMIRRNEP